jgi:protein gp37
MATTIEWTEETWNPATGCTKISPGCKHCYAEGVAERFFAKQYPKNPDGSFRKFTDVRMHPDRLEEPLRRRKPTMYFVNSMSDLFHEDVDFLFVGQVFAVMAKCPQHTFQILTKRPERMLDFFNRTTPNLMFVPDWPLPNVWLGVSVESQKYADQRIPLLLETPAAVRFLSVEPLLEEVDLQTNRNYLRGVQDGYIPPIDWVIVGGESGPGARPFGLAWAEKLRLQCLATQVPFFFKQCGSNPRSFSGVPFTPKDSKGGDLSEVPERLRVRQFPKGKARQ